MKKVDVHLRIYFLLSLKLQYLANKQLVKMDYTGTSISEGNRITNFAEHIEGFVFFVVENLQAEFQPRDILAKYNAC